MRRDERFFPKEMPTAGPNVSGVEAEGRDVSPEVVEDTQSHSGQESIGEDENGDAGSDFTNSDKSDQLLKNLAKFLGLGLIVERALKLYENRLLNRSRRKKPPDEEIWY